MAVKNNKSVTCGTSPNWFRHLQLQIPLLLKSRLLEVLSITILVPCLPIAIKKCFTKFGNPTNIAWKLLGLSKCTRPQIAAQNKKNSESSMLPIIPTEVIIEILKYMPIKSLARVQLVCKEWLANIHEHYFVEKYTNSFPIAYHWHNVKGTEESLDNNNNSSDTDTIELTYLHGLDGLVLLLNRNTMKLFIWNPATKRVLELPHDPHNDADYGFSLSYIPATKNYRVVSVYKDKDSGKECCDVFTPGGHSKTWKHLTFPDNVNLNWHKKDKADVSIISSGGAIHCLLSVKVDDDVIFEEIVSLDIGTERFVVHSVPQSFFEDWTRVYALDWEGKLGFAEINGENLEVMKLDDYKEEGQIRWCEYKKIIHLPFVKKYGYKSSNLVPLFAKEGDIWFWLKGKETLCYTIEPEQLSRSEISPQFIVEYKIYPYKPSLVNIEGMQPEDPKLQIFRPQLLNE